MAPAATITSQADYEVLRLFADGKSEIEIADGAGMTQKAVRDVVNRMCAGDTVVARQLVSAYEYRARAVAAAQGKPGVPGVPRTTAVPPAGVLRPRTTAVPPAGVLRPPAGAHTVAAIPPDRLAQLLHAAAASPNRRVQTLGEKLRQLVDDLRAALDREEQAAAAQRRVEELAAELEKAREALRAASGRPARPAGAAPAAGKTDGVAAKTVRAWAREKGIEVPALGRIPGPVMDAYRQHLTSEQTGDQG